LPQELREVHVRVAEMVNGPEWEARHCMLAKVQLDPNRLNSMQASIVLVDGRLCDYWSQ
jgi:hypothetical protein